MKYLVVVAHPDDECDGAGGTIHKLASRGAEIAVAILAGKAEARRNLSETLESEERKSLSILGVSKLYQAAFPNIQMNAVSNASVVQYVSDCISDSQADVIVTHHPSDTNNDHVVVSYATQEALRQRSHEYVHGFYYLEATSATEWSLNSRLGKFKPNTFVEIGQENLEIKLQALSAYKNVVRPYPHPQCEESYRSLAALRGVQAGCMYAEAFECVFRKLVI